MKMNYYKTSELLNVLGFMSGASSSVNQEKILLYDLWRVLKGEEREGIKYEDFYKMILAIHGYTIVESKEALREQINLFDTSSPSKAKEEKIEEEETLQIKFGYFNEEDIFCLYRGEAHRVARHFNLFYINRVHFIGLHKKIKSNQASEYTFKPQISETSNYLADNYRKRMAKESTNV